VVLPIEPPICFFFFDLIRQKLWRQYVQLTEVERGFRNQKATPLRPIWHRIQTQSRSPHPARLLGYVSGLPETEISARCGSLTPAHVIPSLNKSCWSRSVVICERRPYLHPAYHPTGGATAYSPHLGWSLPEQPPPTIYRAKTILCGTT